MTTEDYKYLAAQLRSVAKEDERRLRGSEREPPLEQQAAEAIEELLTELDMMTNRAVVETPLGTLVAGPSGYGSEHPGVLVDLRRNGKNGSPVVGLALIEFAADEADLEGGHIITRVYGDAMEDEYTDRVIHTGVESFFKAE